ncbi:hypothetical protein AMTRI_Chr06g177130 [Amborella trichopoda]
MVVLWALIVGLATLVVVRTWWCTKHPTLQFFVIIGSESTESFIIKNIQKYRTQVFRTHILGSPMVVFCGATGNKFLFSNENRVLVITWPTSVAKLFWTSIVTTTEDETQRKHYAARFHLKRYWDGKADVKVYNMLKVYTFSLACSLFASIKSEEQKMELSALFNVFLQGMMHMDLKIPGTRYYKAKKAVDALQRELTNQVDDRKEALRAGTVNPKQDLMSKSDEEVVDNIINLLFAGHNTSSSTLLMVLKYLAEKPYYDNEILNGKLRSLRAKKKELLNWEDLKQMNYTWNVVCEVMRVTPEVSGAFRHTITNFDYAAFRIPKGWRFHWNVHTTHKMEEYFPNPSCFEGEGRLVGFMWPLKAL